MEMCIRDRDWLVDTLRRYQAEGCGWLLALDKPTGVPAALCGLTYEQVGAERVLTANCIVRHEPVSYTHLDVYKRQVFTPANCAIFTSEGGAGVWQCRCCAR